jgi:RNA polymerase sigma-70 factor (ECF subfamily)
MPELMRRVAKRTGRFETHAPDLYRYLLRLLRHPQNAEDIAQEVYLRLSRIPDPELARDPRAYLFGVAFHVLREFRMRERREPVTFDSEAATSALDSGSVESTQDELAERLAVRERLERALAELPPRERAILLLVKRDGLSYEEAAREARVSVHQVERYLISARAKLRLSLREI